MNRSILITGVSGSGKSTVAKELRSRGYQAFDIEKIRGLYAHVDGKMGTVIKNYQSYRSDLRKIKESEWDCNVKKLEEILKNNKGVSYYCGTATNIFDFVALFDTVIFLKINSKNLHYRLSHRLNNFFGRKRNVQDWVFGGEQWLEKELKKYKPIVIDANKSLDLVVDEVIRTTNR